MTLTKHQEGDNLTVAVEGRLDTATAPQLEEVLKSPGDGVTRLTLDFAGVTYVSSAGLRVILTAHKQMGTPGRMILRNVNETVMDVFEATGLAKILTFD